MSEQPSPLFPSAVSLKGENNGGNVGATVGCRGTASSEPTADGRDVGPGGRGNLSADDVSRPEVPLITEKSEGDPLDWLTNKSFRSDDAFTIAKQHLRTTDGDEEEGHVEATSWLPSKRQVLTSGSTDVGRQATKRRSPASPHRHDSKKHRHKREHETESYDKHKRKKRHHERHHKDKKRKHSKKKKGRKYSSSSNSGDDSLPVPSETTLLSDDFFVDVKSDRNNLCFDSLHFIDMVAYHRLGHSCLGLDKHRQVISWKDAKAKKNSKSESKEIRYFTSGPVEPEHKATDGTEIGSVEADHHRVQMPQKSVSYIPIDPPSSQPKSDLDPLGIYDSSTQAYIGSVPQMRQAGPAKPQIQSLPASSKTTASYNRHLHENPYDVDKWLEFVRFQDTLEYERLSSTSSGQSLPDGSSDTKQSSRKRTAKMIGERKLAILDKALLRNPNSILLQLEKLEIGKGFWDMTEQTKQWEKLLKSSPDDVMLWREYLLYKQGCFANFSVSKITELYGKCFKTLLAKAEELDAPETAQLENQLLDLFVGLCHLWRQAGHTEKAVAAFQAMVELNCFCPLQFQQDTHLQGQVAFLETFWDSSEPRFGEKEAKGWASWMQLKEKGGWGQVKIPGVEENATEPSSPITDSSDQPLWQAWIQEEVYREQNHFAPWRPNDDKGETEEDCEDPERLVLFDDVNPVLFRPSSPLKQFQLVCRFLNFLGVPVPRCLIQSPGDANDSARLYLEQPSQVLTPGSSSVSSPSMSFSGVAGNCRSIEKSLCSSEGTTSTDSKVTERRTWGDFVEEVFNQITPVFLEPARTQLLLMSIDFQMQRALASAGNKQQRKKLLKEARKNTKKLLSREENRNNLELWAALARWEQSLGHPEEAKRVLQTALVFLGEVRTETDRKAAARLAQTFAEFFICFESQSPVGDDKLYNMEVLHILSFVAEGTAFIPLKDVPGHCVSSTRILKARRNYQELTTLVLASQKEKIKSQDTDSVELSEQCQPSGSYVVHLTKCFAIFQYLTVGMQAASVVFESTLSALKLSNSSNNQQLKLDQELLTEAHVRLLSSHIFNNPSPLGALRNLIKTSLLDFPSNSTLLEAFIYSETKSHIAGRVRRYFDQATKHTGCPTQWVFAIRAELLRQEALLAAAGVENLPIADQQQTVPETGVTHRVRALFDRASECPNSHHCVLLWRMYMQFEVQQGNLKRAESIFYNALQHCPWAKVLYVDAVRHFPSKLQDIQDMLMEKELHIRAPLEEVELLIKS